MMDPDAEDTVMKGDMASQDTSLPLDEKGKNECSKCLGPFNESRLRHLCVACGMSYCDPCSLTRKEVKERDGTYRVCDICIRRPSLAALDGMPLCASKLPFINDRRVSKRLTAPIKTLELDMAVRRASSIVNNSSVVVELQVEEPYPGEGELGQLHLELNINDEEPSCMKCFRPFDASRLKCTCAACGDTYCDACSTARKQVKESQAWQRVCDVCIRRPSFVAVDGLAVCASKLPYSKSPKLTPTPEHSPSPSSTTIGVELNVSPSGGVNHTNGQQGEGGDSPSNKSIVSEGESEGKSDGEGEGEGGGETLSPHNRTRSGVSGWGRLLSSKSMGVDVVKIDDSGSDSDSDSDSDDNDGGNKEKESVALSPLGSVYKMQLELARKTTSMDSEASPGLLDCSAGAEAKENAAEDDHGGGKKGGEGEGGDNDSCGRAREEGKKSEKRKSRFSARMSVRNSSIKLKVKDIMRSSVTSSKQLLGQGSSSSTSSSSSNKPSSRSRSSTKSSVSLASRSSFKSSGSSLYSVGEEEVQEWSEDGEASYKGDPRAGGGDAQVVEEMPSGGCGCTVV